MGFREWWSRLRESSQAEDLELAAPRPELREIATVQNDPTRPYIPGGYLFPQQDDILIQQGGGDLDIYRRVLRDDQVASCWQQRTLALTSREWTVTPGDKRRSSVKAADFIREVVSHVGFDNATEKMLYGRFLGRAHAEINYKVDGTYLAIDTIKVKRQKRFRFGVDGQLLLITPSNWQGEELPERKFWSFSTGGDSDDDPYGLGLAYYLYWPVLFKVQGIRFWLAFAEMYGNPTKIGKYAPGATAAEIAKLKAALRAFSANTGITLPEGMSIELLEASRTGTSDLYDRLLERMDGAISKIILSQTMTTDNGSSQSQANVHMEVRQEITKADADLICGSFNAQVVQWLFELNQDNFPGAAIPRVWRNLEEEEDLSTRADRDKVLFDMGFKLTLDRVTEIYGEGYEEVQPPEPDPNAPLLRSSERGVSDLAMMAPKPDTVTQFVEQLRRKAQPQLEQMIAQIREAMDGSGDLQDFRDKLDEIYPELDGQTLTEIMAEAMFASRLSGLFEAEQEAISE